MEQEEYDIFISYARSDYMDDQKKVIPDNEISKILKRLDDEGFNYWMDVENNYKSETWINVLVNHIKASKIFLFLATERANKSPNTTREIGQAFKHKKPVIPVRIDSSNYNDGVGYFLDLIEHIDYYNNPQKGLDDLVVAINSRLEKLKEEEERKRKEEEDRQRKLQEEIERKRIEAEERQAKEKKKAEEEAARIQQQNLIGEIQKDCIDLNKEEEKLEVDRTNLLLRTQYIKDERKKEELVKEIANSSPIFKNAKKRLEEEYDSSLAEQKELLGQQMERELKKQKETMEEWHKQEISEQRSALEQQYNRELAKQKDSLALKHNQALAKQKDSMEQQQKLELSKQKESLVLCHNQELTKQKDTLERQYKQEIEVLSKKIKESEKQYQHKLDEQNKIYIDKLGTLEKEKCSLNDHVEELSAYNDVLDGMLKQKQKDLETTEGRVKFEITTYYMFKWLTIIGIITVIVLGFKLKKWRHQSEDLASKVDSYEEQLSAQPEPEPFVMDMEMSFSTPSLASDSKSSHYRYTGLVNSDKKPDGNGYAIYSNGDVFVGSFENGKRAKGQYISSKDMYYFEGPYVNDKRDEKNGKLYQLAE